MEFKIRLDDVVKDSCTGIKESDEELECSRLEEIDVIGMDDVISVGIVGKFDGDGDGDGIRTGT